MKTSSPLLFCVALIFCGFALQDLRNDNSPESFFIRGTPEYSVFQKFSEDFGDDELLVFGLCGDLMDGSVRGGLEDFVTDIKKKVPHLKRVVTPMDFIVERGSINSAVKFAKEAGFLGREKSIFGVLLFFKPEVRPYRPEISRVALELKKGWTGRFGCIHAAGPAILNSSLDRAGEEVVKKFFPILLVFTSVSLFLLYRNLVFPVSVLLATGCAELLTLSTIAFSGVPFDLLLTLVPTLVFLFTLSGAVHILDNLRFSGNTDSADLVRDSVDFVYKEKFWPLLYTLLTTGLGFLSLASSSIDPVRNLGIFSAVACAAVWVGIRGPMKFFLVWRLSRSGLRADSPGPGFEVLLVRFFGILSGFRLHLLLLCGLLMAVGTVAMLKLPVETNALNYLNDSDPVRSDMIWVEKWLTGVNPVNILLDGGVSEERVAAFLSTLKKSGLITSVVTEKTFTADPPVKMRAGGEQRVILQVETGGLERFGQLKGEIEKAARLSGTGAVKVTGQYPMIIESQGRMIRTLVNSLLLASLIIGGVIVIIAGNFTLAAAAYIPNITTVFIVFIYMAILDIPVDITTVSVAAVALGIAVDDTIHILICYRENRIRGSAYEEAVSNSLKAAGVPVTVTSAVTGAGFFLLMLSDFHPVHNFGLLMGLTIFTAYILDVSVTPVLLGISRRF